MIVTNGMKIIEALSSAEVETIRRALRATVEGSFFPDWEFQTLIGLERSEVRQILDDWPRQSLGEVEFRCGVVNSLNNLLGYPHGCMDELAAYGLEGPEAISAVLERLISLGL